MGSEYDAIIQGNRSKMLAAVKAKTSSYGSII